MGGIVPRISERNSAPKDRIKASKGPHPALEPQFGDHCSRVERLGKAVLKGQFIKTNISIMGGSW